MKISFTLDVVDCATLEHYRSVADEISDAIQEICQDYPGFTPRHVQTCTDERYDAMQDVFVNWVAPK